MSYIVRKGDNLWTIAARELNDSNRWHEIAKINRLNSPYLLYVDQSLQLPPKQKVLKPAEIFTSEVAARVPAPTDDLGPGLAELKKAFAVIDSFPELKGTGVVLRFPPEASHILRESDHPSGLKTWVVADATLPEPADPRSWWERWNGVVLGCGGAAIGWGSVALSLGAVVPSFGTSTPLLVINITGASASSLQCALAVAKETNEHFQKFAESEDGYLLDYADVALDLIGIAGGVANAMNILKNGGKVLDNYKYVKLLNTERKGKLLKTLARIEKQQGELKYVRDAVANLIKAEKVFDPVGRTLSNNILKRSLPFITKQVTKESRGTIADSLGIAIGLASSYYGGVGPSSFGYVKLVVSILQEQLE
jgi:LysM repeat protein